MKSLLEKEGYEDIKKRLDALTEASARQWGKMTQGQMLHHCQFPLAIAIENKESKPQFNILARLFKKSMYNDKPWRKNLPTAPQLKITDDRDFQKEKQKLDSLIDQFYELRNREHWNPHPMFGTFTKEQWGMMEYKHLDHHFRQFDV